MKPLKQFVQTFFFTLVVICVCDFLAAQAFKIYESSVKSEARLKLASDYATNAKATKAHPLYHHDLKPNIDLTRTYGPLSYQNITNSLGFRDQSVYDVTLKADRPRLLFIGDSFTEGVGLDFEDTFVGIIKNELPTYDVQNAAVSSYAPIIYYRKVKHLIEDVGLKFDTLIVYIDISDAYDEALFYSFDVGESVQGDTRYGKGALTLERPPLWGATQSVEPYLTRNSLLFRVFTSVINSARGYPMWDSPFHESALNNVRSVWTFHQGLYDFYGKKGLTVGRRHMDQLKSMLDQNGIKLIVAVYPWPDQIFQHDLDSIQVSFWRDWARAHDVQLINHFPHFMRTDNKWDGIRNFYFDRDSHWNKAGHRLVADVFLNQFEKSD